MTSPYANANMSPFAVTSTPYQISPRYNYGLPFCSGTQKPRPVLTGPQNMYYMVTRVSSDMASSFSSSYQGLHGSWNTWLSIMQENNGSNHPVLVAPFLPGACSPVQTNHPITNSKTQVAVPIWFDDGGQGGDHVLLSYQDSNTGVFVGNSYRICTFGYTGIQAPYTTTPICGNQIGSSPQTQSDSDAYCYACSPSQKTVLYLSWIDDNFGKGSVILGWMRPNCASVAQELSSHCLCLDSDTDCSDNYTVAYPSLRGSAVDFYMSLGDYHSNTPSFGPIPSDRPQYLQLGDTFLLNMQGNYYSNDPGNLSGWAMNFPQPVVFDSYGPVGDGDNNNIKDWKLYGYAQVRNKSPSYGSNDNLGYFQVMPLGTGSFPSPSVYCATPPSSGDQWYCGGTSLADWQKSNPSCTPSHTTCIRNSLFSGWKCLGSISPGGGGGGGGVCGSTCANVANVCDANGNCVGRNPFLYTPKCTNGKWQCVRKDESWIAIAVVVLIFLLLCVWFFVS